jgi:hypothetical protein
MIVLPEDRTPEDEFEISRRVRIYTRQVEEFGHVTFLPNLKRLVPRGTSYEANEEEEDD